MVHGSARARSALLGVVIGASVVSFAAAQAAGDEVRIETDAGVVEGTLVDKLPTGYLVRVAGKNQVIAYAKVKSIAAKAAPATAAPAASSEASASPGTPLQADSARPDAGAAPAAETAAPVAPSASAAAASAPPPPVWPARAQPPPPAMRRRSPGLAAAGIALTAVGGIGLVAGAIATPVGSALSSANQCHGPSGETFDCEYGSGSTVMTVGIVSLVVGGVLLAGGLPMLVVGRARVPNDQAGRPAAMTTTSRPIGTWSF